MARQKKEIHKVEMTDGKRAIGHFYCSKSTTSKEPQTSKMP
nr:hypothetical protein [Selenomonas sp. mPRGC5]